MIARMAVVGTILGTLATVLSDIVSWLSAGALACVILLGAGVSPAGFRVYALAFFFLLVPYAHLFLQLLVYAPPSPSLGLPRLVLPITQGVPAALFGAYCARFLLRRRGILPPKDREVGRRNEVVAPELTQPLEPPRKRMGGDTAKIDLSRAVGGLGITAAGAIPPYVRYAASKEGNDQNPGLFLALIVAAGVACVVFAICRRIVRGPISQVATGVVLSYAIFLTFLLADSWVNSRRTETTMWLPVIVSFGVPSMMPLLIMSWIGSRFVSEIAGSDGERQMT